MLVLSRKPGESIIINKNIRVVYLESKGNQIRIGIEAPRDIPVFRAEIQEQIDKGIPHKNK